MFPICLPLKHHIFPPSYVSNRVCFQQKHTPKLFSLVVVFYLTRLYLVYVVVVTNWVTSKFFPYIVLYEKVMSKLFIFNCFFCRKYLPQSSREMIQLVVTSFPQQLEAKMGNPHRCFFQDTSLFSSFQVFGVLQGEF